MALIITDKTKIIAIADAIRAQTGSTEPMTLDQLIAAVGEIPSTPDTPDTPEEPIVVSLAAGLYTSEYDSATGTYITPYDKYVAGDIDGANSMLVRSWDDITSSGDITVENHVITNVKEFDVEDKFLVIDDNITSLGKVGVDEHDDYSAIWGPLSVLYGLSGIYIPNSITEIHYVALPYCATELVVAEGSNSVDFYGGAFGAESDFYKHFILPKNVKLHGAMWTFSGTGMEDVFIEIYPDYVPFITITFNGTMDEWRNVSYCYLFGVPYGEDSNYTINVTCTDGVVTENNYVPY